jgi:DNA-directed RNA polymerase specialized sigma24 family protein
MVGSLDADQFEALLQQLAPDRDHAGVRYEQLRKRLLTIFTYRGCANAEELVDATMDRVARKLLEIAPGTVITDPGPYIVGVAWNIARESFRQQRTVALPDRWDAAGPDTGEDAQDERDCEHDCLDRCLRHLRPDDRDLVLTYYEADKRAKIERRAQLARERDISPNALRLRVHRITAQLRECVYRCVERRKSGTGRLH